jgi:glyoxylase-like metal-dependent hydrolase (beta-lactamase superfamily II)
MTQALGSSRVHTMINTHWHPPHTEANQALANRSTRIIAHENTKLWLSRKIDVSWRSQSYGPMPKASQPTETFYTDGSLNWQGETIQYGYLPQAHTDGDIYVFFRNANVLVTGGLIASDGWPYLDYETGGWIGGLVSGLDKLIQLADAKTRIVTLSGPVIARAELERQRDDYRKIYERLVKSLNSGLGPDEAIAAQPAKGINESWGDSTQFATSAFKSLWGHFAPDA